jgi:hypothetical protein
MPCDEGNMLVGRPGACEFYALVVADGVEPFELDPDDLVADGGALADAIEADEVYQGGGGDQPPFLVFPVWVFASW